MVTKTDKCLAEIMVTKIEKYFNIIQQPLQLTALL